MQGKGNNTYTAGYEGKWSTTPTKWSNEYFNNLFDFSSQNQKRDQSSWQCQMPYTATTHGT
jgi:catalase-peroxidase